MFDATLPNTRNAFPRLGTTGHILSSSLSPKRDSLVGFRRVSYLVFRRVDVSERSRRMFVVHEVVAGARGHIDVL